MKITCSVLAVLLCLSLSTAVWADQTGRAIFKAKGCKSCHKLEGPSRGSIPSLPELAEAYKGKKERLIEYFKGKADPILIPKRAISMKRPLKKTKALSDAQRGALAEFILTPSSQNKDGE